MPFANYDEFTLWLEKILAFRKKKLGELNYIFCSDEYLLKVNRDHLNHDYYTDVITFDYCEKNVISGDIFISLDMITYNAKKFLTSQENELKRVMAHGLLHLCGLKDKTEQDSKSMRKAEEEALQLWEESK